MNDQQQIWNEVNQLVTSFSPFYQEGTLELVARHDAPNNWFGIVNVVNAEPEAFGREQAAKTNPYSRWSQQTQNLDALVEAGLLAHDGDAYRATDSGRALKDGFFAMAQARLAQIKPLSEADLADLASLLGGIVENAVGSEKSALKSGLLGSRSTDPGPDAAHSARIDQYATDLLRYRDDAHMAAWSGYGVSGMAWEALTLIWRDEANSAAALAEQLAFRGWSEADYQDVLDQLVNMGWLQKDDQQYTVTEEGKRVREEAEAETDRLFFAGWQPLSAADQARLYRLASEANAALRSQAQLLVWELASETSQSINPITRHIILPLFQEKFADNRLFAQLLTASGNESGTVLLKDTARYLPYTNPELVKEIWEGGVESGYLARNGEHVEDSVAYTLTKAGQETLDEVNELFYRNLAGFQLLPEEDMEQLAQLLARWADACLEAAEPVDKWAILNTLGWQHDGDYAPLARIDRQLDRISTFRDDCHYSAWSELGVGGRSWDALTLVWRDEAHTAAELVEKLSYRGYDETDFAVSLADLETKGWLVRTKSGFRIATLGAKIRQEAEDETNRLFFEPWESLESNEQNQLRNLLLRLKAELRKVIDEQQAVPV